MLLKHYVKEMEENCYQDQIKTLRLFAATLFFRLKVFFPRKAQMD